MEITSESSFSLGSSSQELIIKIDGKIQYTARYNKDRVFTIFKNGSTFVKNEPMNGNLLLCISAGKNPMFYIQEKAFFHRLIIPEHRKWVVPNMFYRKLPELGLRFNFWGLAFGGDISAELLNDNFMDVGIALICYITSRMRYTDG